jgi:hypothetical protein
VLDRHGDIAVHEISIRQLGDRDALPVAIFGHEQCPELVGHIILSQRGARHLAHQSHPVISCQQLTRSGHLERGAELARVSRPFTPSTDKTCPVPTDKDRRLLMVLLRRPSR